MDTFGQKGKRNPDWFQAGIAVLKPALATKHSASLNYKRDPSEKTLAALRVARNDTQGTAIGRANDYWVELRKDPALCRKRKHLHHV